MEYDIRVNGARLHVQRWTGGTGRTDTVLVVAHGIGEHSGYYASWAEMFAMHGVVVVLFDWRGHGLSSGKRGHASLQTLKSDLRAVIRQTREEYVGASVMLYGHSMGGSVALSYAVEGNTLTDGIIAASPWIELLHPPARPLTALIKVMAHTMPSLTVRTGIKTEQLTRRNTEKSTKTDPLMHKKISVKLFDDLWNAGRMLMHGQNRPDVPLLLMFGSEDRIVSRSSGKAFAERVNAEYRLWENMGHDLHIDAGNTDVFQYVLHWIQCHGNIQNPC
ncbi:MAG: lysophospholipase [Bacteroidales bacterium]|nr:lysophospholipase [Bacteroidales bacterium]